jgi:hypothetical protein
MAHRLSISLLLENIEFTRHSVAPLSESSNRSLSYSDRETRRNPCFTTAAEKCSRRSCNQWYCIASFFISQSFSPRLVPSLGRENWISWKDLDLDGQKFASKNIDLYKRHFLFQKIWSNCNFNQILSLKNEQWAAVGSLNLITQLHDYHNQKVWNAWG